MTLKFKNEELTPSSGEAVTGTITVDVAAYDTSFVYSFGSIDGNEVEMEYEITVESFMPDGACNVSDAQLDAMLEAWMEDNETRIIAAWQQEVGTL